ncbi:MAG: response regulator [Spirochaetota bacterium]|nr:response regulator [Spirochaetota bacterium]
MINTKKSPILIAEDDPDDRLLIQEALEENKLASNIRFVEDGEELMSYLLQTNDYTKVEDAPRPALILLDLNMPKKDGREALKEIKNTPSLKQIPVVVLSTSQTFEDISYSYSVGGNSYITKPSSYKNLVEIMKSLGEFWFNVAKLPPPN